MDADETLDNIVKAMRETGYMDVGYGNISNRYPFGHQYRRA